MKKKIGALLCTCLLAFSAAGCAKVVELTEQEQEVIAEYAASAILNYDKGYNFKYEKDTIAEAKADAKKAMEANKNKTEEPKKSEKPTEQATKEPATETPEPTQAPTAAPTPTPTPAPAESQAPPTSAPAQDNNKMSPYDIGKLLGIEGVEVSYIGFEALDSYPVIPEDEMAFVMKANQGAKLVVAKFELNNRSGKVKNCNIAGQNIKFQMRFNGNDFIGVQKTMLNDDFASLNCTLQPDETKRVVIISQVSAGYESNIGSVDLITRVGGENTLIKLQ
ncbi:MAG: hypothetical protein HFI75_13520 [Lachnospiraceae bacterium]|nr:hypothetical protein [Lachnospiraceae bacterium]